MGFEVMKKLPSNFEVHYLRLRASPAINFIDGCAELYLDQFRTAEDRFAGAAPISEAERVTLKLSEIAREKIAAVLYGEIKLLPQFAGAMDRNPDPEKLKPVTSAPSEKAVKP